MLVSIVDLKLKAYDWSRERLSGKFLKNWLRERLCFLAKFFMTRLEDSTSNWNFTSVL